MGANILVVDDSEVVLGVLRLQLDAQGYSVATSISALHGFELLVGALRQDRPFDLLITDLDMPINRGTVLIKAVRELEDYDGVAEDNRLPILVLTGEDLSAISEQEQDELMALGVSYLSKECDIDQLVPSVRNMLRG